MTNDINSKEYWDDRFNKDWEEKDGKGQTSYFANLALALMPEYFKNIINDNRLGILDWGCAQGEGTHLFSQHFVKSKVLGLDFSDIAIEKAKMQYPDHNFLTGRLTDYEEKYDVIFSSNCLEHYEEPRYWLDEIMRYTKDFVVLLLPFQELERLPEHFITFDYNTFNYKVNNFYLVFHKEVEASPTYWPGKQIILIYVNTESKYFEDLNLDMYKLSEAQETLEKSLEVKQALLQASTLHKTVQDLHGQLNSMSEWAKQLNRQIELDKEEIASLNSSKKDTTQKLINAIEELKVKEGLLLSQKETISSQKQNITNLEQTIDNQKSLIVNMEETMKKQEADIAFNEGNIAYLQNALENMQIDNSHKLNEISVLHNELNNMSLWANSMKTRLEVIERSFFLSTIEKIKTKGYRWAIKQAFKRLVPKKLAIKHQYRKKMKNFSEIKSDLVCNNGRFIVVFPVIDWSFRWQRPQHLISKFANDGFTVLYLDMSLIPKGTTYKTESEAGLDLFYTQLENNIYQLHLYSKDEMNIYNDVLKDGNLNNTYLGLSSIFKYLEVHNPIYMIHYPGWHKLAAQLKQKFGGKIVFDCMDDHSGFSSNSSDSVITENELLSDADLVIATSNLLEEKAKVVNNNTILVRNGTEFEHFHKLFPNGELEHLRKPIVGYYGAISDWFDVELLEYCAISNKDMNFVLIGSTWGADVSRISALNNVFLLGEKPYKGLPGYLFYFDVCIIPFKLVPLTMATNPVKFYEYISSGKPVVSIKLPELEQYSSFCYLAENPPEFNDMLRKAIKEDEANEIRNQRIALAKANSWESRYNQLKLAMEKPL